MKISERAIKESIPFTIATKRIKYLGINLPKETKEMGIPYHLTCLLSSLYADQEATVRKKGVHQGCIFSPCLFNFYAV